MNKRLILLTDNFPYGSKETFLEAEMDFLSKGFESVHIFPLQGDSNIRRQASNIHVHKPFLSFQAKDQKRTFMSGLFNLSPVNFILQDFFANAVYKNHRQIRVWLAASFVFRAAFANKKRLSELTSLLSNQTIVYSYWGDKLAVLIPFLRNNNSDFTSVVRFHRTDLYEEFKYGHIPFRRFLFPHIDHFVFISEDGRQYLQIRYPQWVKKAHLFRLGVFDCGRNPANDSVFHLVSCSYMVPVKRIPLLITALQYLDFPLKWTHIGAGLQWDEINRLASRLPQNIQANLLGSSTSQEVISFYQNTPVDLFINVSESEGVPVSIMEALSFGIPVIATNAGGTGEIVDDAVGTLLPVGVTPAEIAAAITSVKQRIANDNLSQYARERWAERCNAEKNYAGFVEFLKTSCRSQISNTGSCNTILL